MPVTWEAEEDHEFKVSLDYIARPCQKKKKGTSVSCFNDSIHGNDLSFKIIQWFRAKVLLVV
jgi:hypothetical protein